MASEWCKHQGPVGLERVTVLRLDVSAFQDARRVDVVVTFATSSTLLVLASGLGTVAYLALEFVHAVVFVVVGASCTRSLGG